MVNNKTYSATKVSLFMANYGRELRIGADIRRKGKVEKVTEFVEKMKKVVRSKPATKPVTLKVHNVKLSFNIWLVLYMYFILYS